MKNILKHTNNGFTLIELVMVTIILGILAAVAIPRYQSTLNNAEQATEKAFVDMVWSGLEEEATNRMLSTGLESWPSNPLSVIGRSRNVILTMYDGIPDEDDEWQFSLDAVGEPALFHQRRNDEVYYYTYDSTTFELSEVAVLHNNVE